MKLDRFYPIFENADWIDRLVPLGIKLVQLRMKSPSLELVRDHLRRAKKTCAQHECTLIVNDYWQLAIEEGCNYVHLGQEDLAGADVKAIRDAGLRLGISTHDRTELKCALAYDPDYVALGPIYPTILKKMKWREQGLNKLSRWREHIGDMPLIAIGGFTIERAQGAYDAGADVVAAVTDITLHGNPEMRVREWLAATR